MSLRRREGPGPRDVVLVGAGHAHVEVLRRFGLRPVPGVRLTLVTRARHTPYSGMLPGLVEGRYGFAQAHIATVPLARFAGARLIEDIATGLDPAGRMLLRAGGPPVPYDLVSLDVGSAPNAVPGAAAHALAVKPVDGFLSGLDALLARVRARGGGALAVVGAGAGGVELLLALERRLRGEMPAADLAFTLVSGASEVLPGGPDGLRRRLLAILEARGIAVATGAPVAAVESGRLILAQGGVLPADEVVWATRAAAPSWLARTGLLLDPEGFVGVDAHLRAWGRDDVFAAGDCAAFAGRPVPKAGVHAVRQGPVLADNIARRLAGRPLRRYRPQRGALVLIGTGDGRALGARSGLVVEGAWVWRWKQHVDARFMARYSTLPPRRRSAPEA
ncbi:hypothetical protein OPKNFCMD_3227 [Methylobacterium crusticola]|uniref:FAD/NAD(P)-binding domain-containing protein n=1 Tax=Methylobacterium crusticola TaxID=1697972 RepID=A0ABQ4R0L1_9HYPH|nr:FAD-dependent oxidoreductase [Methylobacterium crusticola]GJD50485.1 hypothetical protein OPKNFCMD_3227 [Methylobacterium crusticola]